MKRDRLLGTLAAAWLIGVMALFYVRFSAAFYEGNRDAIAALLRRLMGA